VSGGIETLRGAHDWPLALAVRTARAKSNTWSMREYDLIADWYQGDRGRTVGVAEALAVAATLPAHSRILDVGCGNGVPITEALVNAGHCVIGLDSSAGMLARFRVNLPGTPIVRGDARHCPFVDGSFDAAISWGMMFHLTPADQAAVFASVSRALKSNAPFLFTATEIDGVDSTGITGTMNGVTFHYYAVRSYQRGTNNCDAARHSARQSQGDSSRGSVKLPIRPVTFNHR
jgi:ubiquinone/menaquinone biosynthesis C-methylase UbiE